MRSFRSLSSAKATFSAIEAVRTIKKHQYEAIELGVAGEIKFLAQLFPTAA